MGAVIVALFAFLALYTWNARTGYLDSAAEHSGLEITGYILLPGVWIKDNASHYWNRYVSLINVAEENARLREALAASELHVSSVREEMAELTRLRALVGVKPPEGWGTLGTRVIAGRFGSSAALETVMIDRGFSSGAAPGTPLVTEKGLVGRVFRASPHIATVLLLTDQSFRVGVVSQNGRVPGVLAGTGINDDRSGKHHDLEVRYMAPNTEINEGELLVTSGIDGMFPKGIPVARITSVNTNMETLFPEIKAEPLASLGSLEEALLLVAPEGWPQERAVPDLEPVRRTVSTPATEQAATAAEEARTEPQPARRPAGRSARRTQRQTSPGASNAAPAAGAQTAPARNR